jgi:hypothetical protein
VSRRGPARGPRPQVLIALWGAGLVLFNFPMLTVWDRDATVLGLPLLPVALFVIWAALIGVLAWVSERPSEGTRDGTSARANRDQVIDLSE